MFTTAAPSTILAVMLFKGLTAISPVNCSRQGRRSDFVPTRILAVESKDGGMVDFYEQKIVPSLPPVTEMQYTT